MNRERLEKKSHKDEIRQRLLGVRNALLSLHKALVDAEKVTYEKTFGPIHSTHQLLQLVTRDPWFAWLHPLSKLIVSMDEALDEKEPLTVATVNALIKESGALLVASESGEGFGRHYFDALQNDPSVVMAHADTTKLVKPRR